MNTRERFHAVMDFRPFDRLPLLGWAGWWEKTINRWCTESLPMDLKDRYAICEHFGLNPNGKGGFLISCDHQTPPGVSYAVS